MPTTATTVGAVRVQLGDAPHLQDAPMTGAEMQTIREGLGLTRAELFALLNRDPDAVESIGDARSIQRYETKGRVPGWLELTLYRWEQAQAETVAEIVAVLADERDVTMTLPADGAGGFPAGYWRALAWLVSQQVPDLRWEYASE